MTEGDTATITATITPSDATNKNITWSSSDTSVATVVGGVVTAIKEGTATITAAAEDGGYTAETKVTVNAKQITSIDFMDSSMASFEANTSKLTFSVKGILVGEIDTSKLKYITSKSGEHSISLSSGYTKSEMQDMAAGKYYYTNDVDGETRVCIKLTDSDAAKIKELDGYGNTSRNVNDDNDRLIAENSWYPDAVAGTKAVSISNYVKVKNSSGHEIFGVFQLDDDGMVITSSGRNPGYTKGSEFNVLADSFTTKLVFYEGDYVPLETPTDGLMRIVSLTDDVIENGITIDDSNWIEVEGDNFGKEPTKIPVEEITVKPEAMELTVGGATGTITATITPSDATNKNITWSSSDTSVATVVGGVVTAIKEGTATITAKSEDGGKTATTEVTVLGTITITEISDMTLDLNSTESVIIVSNPSDTDKTVESNKPDVVEVSAVKNNQFTITAKSIDNATITVTCAKEGYVTEELSFNVTVAMSDAQKLAADKELLTLPLGGNSAIDNIKANLGTLPTELLNGTKVEWVSSNTSVISNDGTVTRPATSESDAAVTMTAKLTNGNASDEKTFNLTVKRNMTQLGTPKDVTINEFGSVCWKYNGTYYQSKYDYDVLIYKNNEYIETKKVIGLVEDYNGRISISAELSKNGPGYYSVQIRIKREGYEDSELTSRTTSKYQLADPTPYWDNYIARWNQVINADQYYLYLYENGNSVKWAEYGREYTLCSQNSYDFSKFKFNPGSKYTFGVRATNDDGDCIRSGIVISDIMKAPTSEIGFTLVTTSASINYDSSSRNVRVCAENGASEILLEVTRTKDQTVSEINGIDLPIYSQTDTETGIKVVYRISTVELTNNGCKILKLRVSEEEKISNDYTILVAGKLKAPSLNVTSGQYGNLTWEASDGASQYYVTYYFEYTDDSETKIKTKVYELTTSETKCSATLILKETGPYGGVFTATVTPIYGDLVGFESKESNGVNKLASVTSGSLTRIGDSKAVKATWKKIDGEKCVYRVVLLRNGGNYYGGAFETEGNENEMPFYNLDSGEYSFTVQKIGDGSVVNSNASEKFGSVEL